MNNKYVALGFVAIALLMGGCAKEIGSDTYSDAEAGAIKQTYRGTVISARKVKVQGEDKLENNSLGLIGGGLAGGVLGSQIGKGRGSTVGMVAGAGAGALGGSLAQQALSKQEGMEYTVELTSGRIMTIVQGLQPPLQVGQPVLVMVGNKGRSRVVADQSAGFSNRAVGAARRETYKDPRSRSRRSGPVRDNRYDDNRYQENRPYYEDDPRAEDAYYERRSRFDQVDAHGRDTYARDYDERGRGVYPREYPGYLN